MVLRRARVVTVAVAALAGACGSAHGLDAQSAPRPLVLAPAAAAVAADGSAAIPIDSKDLRSLAARQTYSWQPAGAAFTARFQLPVDGWQGFASQGMLGMVYQPDAGEFGAWLSVLAVDQMWAFGNGAIASEILYSDASRTVRTRPPSDFGAFLASIDGLRVTARSEASLGDLHGEVFDTSFGSVAAEPGVCAELTMHCRVLLGGDDLYAYLFIEGTRQRMWLLDSPVGRILVSYDVPEDQFQHLLPQVMVILDGLQFVT